MRYPRIHIPRSTIHNNQIVISTQTPSSGNTSTSPSASDSPIIQSSQISCMRGQVSVKASPQRSIRSCIQAYLPYSVITSSFHILTPCRHPHYVTENSLHKKTKGNVSNDRHPIRENEMKYNMWKGVPERGTNQKGTDDDDWTKHRFGIRDR